MLNAKDCANLTPKDWAGIATKLMKLKDGEQVLLSVSDEHEGGVTSRMPEVKEIIQGFASKADIVLLNGDDFEFESPVAFKKRFEEIKQQFPQKGTDYWKALQVAAEEVLHEKVAEDIATLRAMIQESPNRKIIKVIGNHENFKTFRDELTKLEAEHPNFQWTPEVAMIPMPGGTKETRDRLLATHGDLQMDDLWFVEDGGTDKERKCYDHKEMAAKVVSIATTKLAPSAEKQEKSQGIVNWWRKPNATAKTLYAELLFRAQEGDYSQQILKTDRDLDKADLVEKKLKKRRVKFEEFKEELANRQDIMPEQREAEALVYSRAIEKMDRQLQELKEHRAALEKKSGSLPAPAFHSLSRVLNYKTLGKKDPKLFTSEKLKGVTHINYGHTHVSAEGVKIKGFDDVEVTVSNNASVTGAIMQRPLDATGKPRTLTKGETPTTDLGNLGLLLYRVKDGKITDITTVGRLITENLHVAKALIRDAQKSAGSKGVDTPKQEPQPGAIAPETIVRKKADQHDAPPGAPL